MKKINMKHSILGVLFVCLFTTANAQKTKVAPAQAQTKTFIVSEETKKDLPEGVTFTNNKISLKSGYKFEQMPNNGGVKLINAKANVTGRFKCYCNVSQEGQSCTLIITGNSISCSGESCCAIQVGVDVPKVIKMNQN